MPDRMHITRITARSQATSGGLRNYSSARAFFAGFHRHVRARRGQYFGDLSRSGAQRGRYADHVPGDRRQQGDAFGPDGVFGGGQIQLWFVG